MAGDLRQRLAVLRTEDGIFERVFYKSKSQHGCTLHFRKLQEVRRSLKLLRVALSDQFLNVLDGGLSSGRKLKHGKTIATANTLWGIARILHELNRPILSASKQLAGLLQQGRFSTFTLTVLSVLARIRVVSFQLMLDTVSLYNLIQAKIASFVSTYDKLQQELPSSLECKWDPERSQYELIENKPNSDAWFVNDRSGKQRKKAKLSSPLPVDETPAKSQAPSLKAAQFLDFVEGPASTGKSNEVAFVTVDPSLTPSSTLEKIDSAPVSNGPKDDIFDLLLSKRTSQSIF